jgi:Ni/Co efflux regulator RcnB
MKTSAIVCALLAGTLGFGSLPQAQDWRGRHDGGHRTERQDNRGDNNDRRDWRAQRRDDRRQDWNNNQPRYQQQPRYGYNQPQYQYNQPAYVYNQPRYYSQAPRFYRGGTLPYEYRQRNYYVNNWNAYPGLYAPPYGYQWMQVGNDFMLVALATGLIASLLTQ